MPQTCIPYTLENFGVDDDSVDVRKGEAYYLGEIDSATSQVASHHLVNTEISFSSVLFTTSPSRPIR